MDDLQYISTFFSRSVVKPHNHATQADMASQIESMESTWWLWWIVFRDNNVHGLYTDDHEVHDLLTEDPGRRKQYPSTLVERRNTIFAPGAE